MTFESREESRSQGEPLTIYRFTIGEEIYAYTDADRPIWFEGETYSAIPIDRDSINTSGTLDKSALTIRVPHDTPIAELFRIFPPSEVVGLTIFQGHDGEPEIEFRAIWAGRVLSRAVEGSEASLSCEPVNTSMKRPMLRGRYQYQCRHALYRPGCNLNRDDFKVTATVVSVSGSTVTFADGWNGSFAEARFANGIMEWDGSTRATRQILNVDSTLNRLRIGGSTAGLTPGMTVSLNPGCNHTMGNCNLFNNILNFGGMPWIPKRNPIGQSNQFY